MCSQGKITLTTPTMNRGCCKIEICENTPFYKLEIAVEIVKQS